jgi:hypothetical protein
MRIGIYIGGMFLFASIMICQNCSKTGKVTSVANEQGLENSMPASETAP